MTTRRGPDHGVAARKVPPPVTPTHCGPKVLSAATNTDRNRVVGSSLLLPVATSFPTLGPITASPHGIRIDKLVPPAVQAGIAHSPPDPDDNVNVELFGESPVSPTAATGEFPSAQPPGTPSVTPSEPQSSEDILWEFYNTRNKKPSYEERVELSKATGLLSEYIAQWFVLSFVIGAGWWLSNVPD